MTNKFYADEFSHMLTWILTCVSTFFGLNASLFLNTRIPGRYSTWYSSLNKADYQVIFGKRYPVELFAEVCYEDFKKIMFPQLQTEQGSYVGEVVKVMDKKKVLVKVHPEGKFVVDIDKNIDVADITANCRVALRNDSYTLHKILPNKVDPLVRSLFSCCKPF